MTDLMLVLFAVGAVGACFGAEVRWPAQRWVFRTVLFTGYSVLDAIQDSRAAWFFAVLAAGSLVLAACRTPHPRHQAGPR